MSTNTPLVIATHTDASSTEKEERLNDVVFPTISQKKLAWLDVKEGIQKWRIWLLLAYQDIKLRYRRSVLGPFWITLSMAITVYSMGFLYAHLFHTNLQQYYPFLVAGMLSWALLSTAVIDVSDAFMLSDSLLKQIKLPYSLYIHRVMARNIIIFFHNTLVMLPIFILFHEVAKVNLYSLLLFPGLALIYINGIIYGLILAMIGVRYRDISQMIKSLIQVVFFVTPILWNPATLPSKVRIFVDINPFYAFIELIRAPLLGNTPTLLNLMMTLFVTAIGLIICSIMFSRYRARIIYWL